MVLTKKFSEFNNGNDLENDDTTVGLRGGVNTKFDNPWVFLAPGTTAERPAPSDAIAYRLRFNEDLRAYEFYDNLNAEWVQFEKNSDLNELIARLAAHTAGDGASMIGLQDLGAVVDKTVQNLAAAVFVTSGDESTVLANSVQLSSLALLLAGGTMAGAIDMDSNAINNLPAPVLPGDATNKAYVDGLGTGTVTAGLENELAFYPADGDTVEGLATGNSATLVTSSTGVPSYTASMQDGELLIGVTGGTPVPATLTAGPGISIAQSAGGVTISGTGSGIGWTEVTSTTKAMVSDNGYIANNSSEVVFTLPTTAAVGTVINVVGKGSGGWKIEQNAGQNINIGDTASTSGTGGNVSSTNQHDSLQLLCVTADTVWTASVAPQGNINIV
jgi:hypothetical protein